MSLPDIPAEAPAAGDLAADVKLTDEEMDAVGELIVKLGVIRAARRLCTSRESLARVSAGLPVRRGTIASMRAGLTREAARK